MKYPKALTGAKLFVPAEVLCVFASLIEFIMEIIMSNVDASAAEENTILVNRLLVGLVAINALNLIAFVMKVIGFQIARKDERQFRKSLFFSIIGIIFSVIFFFTAGKFSDFMWGVIEVATLLVVVYAILAFYNLAETEDNQDVMKRGKIALVMVAIIFGFAVINKTITVFTPAADKIFTILSAALDLLGHAVFLSFLVAAKKMLKNATV